jgi:hypothetical protein
MAAMDWNDKLAVMANLSFQFQPLLRAAPFDLCFFAVLRILANWFRSTKSGAIRPVSAL